MSYLGKSVKKKLAASSDSGDGGQILTKSSPVWRKMKDCQDRATSLLHLAEFISFIQSAIISHSYIKLLKYRKLHVATSRKLNTFKNWCYLRSKSLKFNRIKIKNVQRFESLQYFRARLVVHMYPIYLILLYYYITILDFIYYKIRNFVCFFVVYRNEYWKILKLAKE